MTLRGQRIHERQRSLPPLRPKPARQTPRSDDREGGKPRRQVVIRSIDETKNEITYQQVRPGPNWPTE